MTLASSQKAVQGRGSSMPILKAIEEASEPVTFGSRSAERFLPELKIRSEKVHGTFEGSASRTPQSISSAKNTFSINGCSNDKVKVYVRMRPFSESEKVCPLKQVLCLIGDKIVIRDLDNHCQKSTGNSKELGHKHDLIEFKVDYMQDDSYLRVQSEARKEESQQRMYGALGVPCIETALDGYNTTILAYGQTGSGKTYTMMGDGTEAGKGLIPRLACDLMNKIHEENRNGIFYTVQASYVEIYQEKIRDLLAAEDDQRQEALLGAPSTMDAGDIPAANDKDALRKTGTKVGKKLISRPFKNSADRTYTRADTGYYQAMKKTYGGPLLERSPSSMYQDGAPKVRSPKKKSPKPAFDTVFGKEKIHKSYRTFPIVLEEAVPMKRQTFLKIREHPVTGPFVDGLLWKDVCTWLDMETLMRQGSASRTTAATDMNEKSSRSHAIFTIRLTRNVGPDMFGVQPSSVSYINLVDLAGSEKLPKLCSGAVTGQRTQEESKCINQSLSQLNEVIMSLSRSSFVSYRNSVLTWLLKESLGGNSRTFMVANISPTEKDLRESVNTLRYATTARRIPSPSILDQDSRNNIIHKLKEEICTLRSLLSSFTSKRETGPSDELPWMQGFKVPILDVGLQTGGVEEFGRRKVLDKGSQTELGLEVSASSMEGCVRSYAGGRAEAFGQNKVLVEEGQTEDGYQITASNGKSCVHPYDGCKGENFGQPKADKGSQTETGLQVAPSSRKACVLPCEGGRGASFGQRKVMFEDNPIDYGLQVAASDGKVQKFEQRELLDEEFETKSGTVGLYTDSGHGAVLKKTAAWNLVGPETWIDCSRSEGFGRGTTSTFCSRDDTSLGRTSSGDTANQTSPKDCGAGETGNQNSREDCGAGETRNQTSIKDCGAGDTRNPNSRKDCGAAEKENQSTLEDCGQGETGNGNHLHGSRAVNRGDQTFIRNFYARDFCHLVSFRDFGVRDAANQVTLRDCGAVNVAHQTTLKDCGARDAGLQVTLQDCGAKDAGFQVTLQDCGAKDAASQVIPQDSGAVELGIQTTVRGCGATDVQEQVTLDDFAAKGTGSNETSFSIRSTVDTSIQLSDCRFIGALNGGTVSLLPNGSAGNVGYQVWMKVGVSENAQQTNWRDFGSADIGHQVDFRDCKTTTSSGLAVENCRVVQVPCQIKRKEFKVYDFGKQVSWDEFRGYTIGHQVGLERREMHGGKQHHVAEIFFCESTNFAVGKTRAHRGFYDNFHETTSRTCGPILQRDCQTLELRQQQITPVVESSEVGNQVGWKDLGALDAGHQTSAAVQVGHQTDRIRLLSCDVGHQTTWTDFGTSDSKNQVDLRRCTVDTGQQTSLKDCGTVDVGFEIRWKALGYTDNGCQASLLDLSFRTVSESTSEKDMWLACVEQRTSPKDFATDDILSQTKWDEDGFMKIEGQIDSKDFAADDIVSRTKWEEDASKKSEGQIDPKDFTADAIGSQTRQEDRSKKNRTDSEEFSAGQIGDETILQNCGLMAAGHEETLRNFGALGIGRETGSGDCKHLNFSNISVGHNSGTADVGLQTSWIDLCSLESGLRTSDDAAGAVDWQGHTIFPGPHQRCWQSLEAVVDTESQAESKQFNSLDPEPTRSHLAAVKTGQENDCLGAVVSTPDHQSWEHEWRNQTIQDAQSASSNLSTEGNGDSSETKGRSDFNDSLGRVSLYRLCWTELSSCNHVQETRWKQKEQTQGSEFEDGNIGLQTRGPLVNAEEQTSRNSGEEKNTLEETRFGSVSAETRTPSSIKCCKVPSQSGACDLTQESYPTAGSAATSRRSGGVSDKTAQVIRNLEIELHEEAIHLCSLWVLYKLTSNMESGCSSTSDLEECSKVKFPPTTTSIPRKAPPPQQDTIQPNGVPGHLCLRKLVMRMCSLWLLVMLRFPEICNKTDTRTSAAARALEIPSALGNGADDETPLSMTRRKRPRSSETRRRLQYSGVEPVTFKSSTPFFVQTSGACSLVRGRRSQNTGDPCYDIMCGIRSRRVIHFLKEGVNRLGSSKNAHLYVASLSEDHTEFVYMPAHRCVHNKGYVVVRLAAPGALGFLNGAPLLEHQHLYTGDVLVLRDVHFRSSICTLHFFNLC